MTFCSLRQALAGWFADAPFFQRLANRHAARCPECRRHLQALQALAHHLARPADADPPPLPAALRRRILASAASSRSPVKSQSRQLPFLSWQWAGAAVAACLVTALVLHRSGSAPVLETNPHPLNLAIPALASTPSLESFVAALQQPLATEANASIAHGRDLLAGMVRSALPEPALAAVLRETGGPDEGR